MTQKNARANAAGTKPTILMVLFAIMIVSAVVLRATSWVVPPSQIPLLAPADGLVQTETVAEAEITAHRTILAPTDLFGSEVAAVGVYTQGITGISQGSSAIELVRDGWRFVEILEEPNVTLEEVVAPYKPFPEQTVVLAESVSGKLVSLDRRFPQCVEGQDGNPGVCQISRVLIFQTPQSVISIAADGAHATEGELIALARSILTVAPLSTP